MFAAMSTAKLGDALGAAIDALAAAGVDSPRLDAELMLEAASGFSRSEIVASPERELPSGAGSEFGRLVRRRAAREPVAYILGRKGFRSIELRCDRRALIPRPETELLVEIAVELQPSKVLDVGTGSGAIALAVADEIPDCEVFATDLSPSALALAAENATSLGLAHRVTFELASVPGEGPAFDLLLSNLPYVAEAEWPDLEPELREFEPPEALVPGPTGLEAIEELIRGPSGIASLGGPPPATALEVGEGQAGDVAEMLSEAGYGRIEVRRDLAGIERVVLGRR